MILNAKKGLKSLNKTNLYFPYDLLVVYTWYVLIVTLMITVLPCLNLVMFKRIKVQIYRRVFQIFNF